MCVWKDASRILQEIRDGMDIRFTMVDGPCNQSGDCITAFYVASVQIDVRAFMLQSESKMSFPPPPPPDRSFLPLLWNPIVAGIFSCFNKASTALMTASYHC